MLKALIFDFDGLMIDTEYTYYPIYKNYFEKYHQHTMLMDEFLVCIGSEARVFIDLMHGILGDSFDEAHFVLEKQALFKEASSHLPMMEGVLDLIQKGREAGLKIAIATSSHNPHAENHLKRWGIYDRIDLIVSGDMVKRVKPSPDIFEKTLELLDIRADEAIVFEDSLNGLRAAVSAGIKTVVVPNRVTMHSKFENYALKLESLKGLELETLYDL